MVEFGGTEVLAASPVQGTVASVAAPGDHLRAGDAVAVIESMKMEYVVAADRDVVVAEVRRKAGDRVTIGEPIVAFR